MIPKFLTITQKTKLVIGLNVKRRYLLFLRNRNRNLPNYCFMYRREGRDKGNSVDPVKYWKGEGSNEK